MADDQTLEQRIRERAYQLWVEDGQPVGKESEHWEKARTEIEGHAQKSEDKPATPTGTSFGP